MNRRNFLSRLEIGAAACAVVPSVVAKETFSPEKLHCADVDLIKSYPLTPNEVVAFYRQTGILLIRDENTPLYKHVTQHTK